MSKIRGVLRMVVVLAGVHTLGCTAIVEWRDAIQGQYEAARRTGANQAEESAVEAARPRSTELNLVPVAEGKAADSEVRPCSFLQDTQPQRPTIDSIQLPGSEGAISIPQDDVVRLNKKVFSVSGTCSEGCSDVVLTCTPEQGNQRTFKASTLENNKWTAQVKGITDGLFTLTAKSGSSDPSEPVSVLIRTDLPRIVHVDAPDFNYESTANAIYVAFDSDHELDIQPGTKEIPNFELRKNDYPTDNPHLNAVDFLKDRNTVILRFPQIAPGRYTIVVKAPDTEKNIVGIRDVFGNKLTNDLTYDLVKEVGGIGLSTRPGVRGSIAPSVTYPEFTAQRTVPKGFNPADHVETRVCRLYYYRDAHRVAQIINRDARSYNRMGTDRAGQLADNARTLADQRTEDRRAAERQAIEAARQTRDAEAQLREAELKEANAVQAANEFAMQIAREQQSSSPSQTKIDKQQKVLDAALKVASKSKEDVDTARALVEAKRREEFHACEQAEALAGQEDRAREEQFRREVAAGREDPDTYAPGKPNSVDPVAQVSISVIGEGVLQLRGPLKGINIVRRMINEIDAPVGQVRVAVHTLQVNGEHGDRMEKVAARIQQYIDQSRFLTVQSSEMLRKAVATEASEKAWPQNYDQKITAFFGQDFYSELKKMDSELIKPGNALLSLHPQETTSLSSALLIWALANKDAQQGILERFKSMMACDLAQAEEDYVAARMNGNSKHPGFWPGCKDKTVLLAGNAKFASLRGYFDTPACQGDSMTPVQREFIALAQILKARLTIEMENKEQVIERALMEKRKEEETEKLRKNSEADVRLQKRARLLNEQLLPKCRDAIKTEAGDAESSKNVLLNSMIACLVEDTEGAKFAASATTPLCDRVGMSEPTIVIENEIENLGKENPELVRDWNTWVESKKTMFLVEKDIKESNATLTGMRAHEILLDETEDRYAELLEGTRARTANIDSYLKRLTTALEDDFNTQFYYPAFRQARQASRYWDVNFGQVETTSILANNREFAKVSPQATMEFDLPKRDILINEAMNGAKAAIDDFGALVNDPTFIGLAQMKSGQSTATSNLGAGAVVRSVLPGLPSESAEALISQGGSGNNRLGTAMDALIPDPAVYKFETGTGFELRPVIQPDGQAVVFRFDYMYTTNVREPVRADEKHLGRVKRHLISTDVQLSNYELREISRYQVALKASRTSRGVPLLEDIPAAGVLFRPLPQQESSLQENLVYGQSVIYPTLFDLMGLRWAPVVADLDAADMKGKAERIRTRSTNVADRIKKIAEDEVDKVLVETQKVDATPAAVAKPQGKSATGLNGTLDSNTSALPSLYPTARPSVRKLDQQNMQESGNQTPIRLPAIGAGASSSRTTIGKSSATARKSVTQGK